MDKLLKKGGLAVVVLLAAALAFTGCDDGSSGGSVKSLVITGITSAQYAEAARGMEIGVLTPGTTVAQALSGIGLAAGSDDSEITVSGYGPYTISTLLYSTASGFNLPWTGAGVYDVVLILENSFGVEKVYRAYNVSFVVASTTLNAASFVHIP